MARVREELVAVLSTVRAITPYPPLASHPVNVFVPVNVRLFVELRVIDSTAPLPLVALVMEVKEHPLIATEAGVPAIKE